jgi:hypothetical protein
VGRVGGHDLLHALDRQLGAVEARLGQVGDAEQRLHPLLPARGGVDPLLEQLGQLLPALLRAQHALEV